MNIYHIFRKKWIAAGIITLVLALTSISFFHLRSVAGTSYEFVEVKRRDVEKSVLVEGTVKPAEETELRFKETGRVEKVLAEVGQEVKTGQFLAVLDQTEYSNQVKRFLAELEVAKAGVTRAESDLKKELEHYEKLQSQTVSSYSLDAQRTQIKSARAIFDVNKANMEAAQIALNRLKNQRLKSRLAAPHDGIISGRSVETGDVVTSSQTAFSLINPEAYVIEAYVDQKDASEIPIGNKAVITFNNCFLGEEITLPVASIDHPGKNPDPNSYSRIFFELGKTSECVKSNAKAEVEIEISKRDGVLAILASSAIKRDDLYFVLVKDELRGLKEKEIKTGLAGTNGLIEVLSGVEEGEKVLDFSK